MTLNRWEMLRTLLPFTLLVASRLAHRKLPRMTWWAIGLVTVALGGGLAAAAPSGGGYRRGSVRS